MRTFIEDSESNFWLQEWSKTKHKGKTLLFSNKCSILKVKALVTDLVTDSDQMLLILILKSLVACNSPHDLLLRQINFIFVLYLCKVQISLFFRRKWHNHNVLKSSAQNIFLEMCPKLLSLIYCQFLCHNCSKR